MIQDDEFEVLTTSSERVNVLGFKPQKEILINQLLPYAEELDEESNRFLKDLKSNLAKAVLLREIKPACGVWSSRLIKYIRMYGLKFGKEDHIALIKLAYELVIIPDLEPCKVHKFATLFILLTKKRHLISNEELTLEWRPLYEVGKKIFDKSTTHYEMFHYLTPKPSENQRGTGTCMLDMIRKFMSGDGLEDALALLGLIGPGSHNENELPISLEGSYLSMVKAARPYFRIDATKEILAEFLPQISPWTGEGHMVGQLSVFLPVGLNPVHADMGHKLWFDHLMGFWDTCYNSPCGTSDLLVVFAGLAKKSPGLVDWTPYIPKMFTRFLRALNLPVCYKDMQYSKSHSLDTKKVATWIVWCINPDGLILKHLRSFLEGVESYLHSANSGRWSFRLRDLLRKLAREFLNRVRREREKKFQDSWENKTPEGYKLRDLDINEFISIVLGPTLQAVYSRSGSLDISLALQNLAILRPAMVVPPLLEKLKTSLTSLTEPHRVTAAMSAVAAVARPMLRGADAGYPEGTTHVVPFLMAVLPGLDPNDIKKTLVSLHFILIFSSMVPYIDCSSAHEYWSDLTEEELLTCESTAQMEDFVLIFFDRLFTIIESSVFEQARIDIKDSDGARSKTDAIMESGLACASTAVLMQCSPKIFREALRKFKSFATNTTFETNVSGCMVGVLLRVFARVNSEATLAVFLPELCEELSELLSSDETLHEENPPRDLMYRLLLLRLIVECDGSVLLKYIPNIVPVLDRALKLHSKNALTQAAETLSHIFVSFCSIDLFDWKSSVKDYSTAPEKWLPIREWGHGCLLKESDLKWHVPSAEEAACAQMLVDRYLKPELVRLRQWLSGERPMCRERRMKSFYVINAVFSCSTFLPTSDEEPVKLMETQVPATKVPFATGVKYTVTLDGSNLRANLISLLLEVQTKLLNEKTDDTRGLDMLIQLWERVVCAKAHRIGPGVETRMRSFSALERALDGRGCAAREARAAARLRWLLGDAARLQDEARLDLFCDAGITPSLLNVLHALYQLSIYTYTSVRMLAQARLYWMMGRYAYSYRMLVPRLVSTLAAADADTGSDEWHAKHKGALFAMLGPRNGPLVAKQDWEIVNILWPAVLKAPLSEKPVIVKLEQAFSDSLHRHFPAVNTRLTITDSATEAAKYFLTNEELNDKQLQEDISKAVEVEKESSDRRERAYIALVEELVDIAETPNIQWRRLELVMQVLTYCPSLQTDFPARAVRLVLRMLVHDDIAVRRTAQKLTHMALKQRKRDLKKIFVDPYQVNGLSRPDVIVPGYREDLEWVMYDNGRVPETDEEWDKPWLRNPIYGFFTWPDKLEVAAPPNEQTFSSDIKPEDMEEGERYIYEFFVDEHNVDKLVTFLTAEEKKGKDKFNAIRFSLFRTLFAQYGEQIADRFLTHAIRCAGDSQEAPQRFASEIAAAALRAPRYWSRERALPFYDKAVEILKIGLCNVTPETSDSWGTCTATGALKLDAVRGGRALAELLRACAPRAAPHDTDNDTSFTVCAKLYALQGILSSLSWRGAPLSAEVLRLLEETQFIQHPYQNVRDAVGSTLMCVFDCELVFPGGSGGPAPRLDRFLHSLRPRLAALYDQNGDIVIRTAVSALEAGGARAARSAAGAPGLALPLRALRIEPARPRHDVAQQRDEDSEEIEESPMERELSSEKELPEATAGALQLGDAPAPCAAAHADAVNLLTTVFRGCMGICMRGACRGAIAQHALVRCACALGARGTPHPHDELARAADAFLAALALADHDPAEFDNALGTLDELADDRSWWARLAAIDFAQPLLFYGLPLLCAQPDRAVRAEGFALKLMRDPRLEVRQAAAKLLTGLMHCRALPDEARTVRSLRSAARSRLLVERHCGVLGLCAYLASRPYTLGSQLGEILAELSLHTNAPDPIPATIRTALADFRRTHQDDWPRHREQLTEEELDLLADLTSPPSYCA